MKKRVWTVATLLLIMSALAGCRQTQKSAPTRPNVIVLIGDDVGYGDLGWLGSKTVRTENVNRIAEQGVRFTNCHATSATSTPSRYGLLTGLYPWRRDDTGIAAGNAPMIIRPEQYTLADLFQSAGYHTAAIGKWHLGLGAEQGTQNWNDTVRPNLRDIGFEYSYIMAATADRVPCVFIENGAVVGLDKNDPIEVSYKEPFAGEPTYLTNPEMCRVHPSDGHACSIVDGIPRIGYMKGGMSARWHDENIADSITEHAVRYIEAHQSEPFFLYLGTNDIHVPRVPHERFQGTTSMGPRGDAIMQFDYTVGRVTRLLDSLGIADNTLLILTSDNGPVVDDGYRDGAVEKLGEHRPGGGYRGGKYSIYEAGTRVPCVVRWPGKVKAGEWSDAAVSLLDLMPSLAELIGVELPEGAAADAESHLKDWLGNGERGREYVVEQNLEGTLSITMDGYKYIEPSNGSPYNPNVDIELGNHPYEQLYNLREDSTEQHNLATDMPEMVERLREKLNRIKSTYK